MKRKRFSSSFPLVAWDDGERPPLNGTVTREPKLDLSQVSLDTAELRKKATVSFGSSPLLFLTFPEHETQEEEAGWPREGRKGRPAFPPFPPLEFGNMSLPSTRIPQPPPQGVRTPLFQNSGLSSQAQRRGNCISWKPHVFTLSLPAKTNSVGNRHQRWKHTEKNALSGKHRLYKE